MNLKNLKNLMVAMFLVAGSITVWKVWEQQAWAENKILGQMIGIENVNVLKIVQDENKAAIILPRESVRQSTEGAFVLTVENYQVQKKLVEAQEWREKYYKIIKGLENEDLVILDEKVVGQQVINYVVINPEAGQSGVIDL